MWTQMILITITSLALSIVISQVFNLIAPEGMPFSLTLEKTMILSVVFLLIGFIGTTIASVQIKKIEPLQAIQQGEI
jgi:putative ABC transport system permease protein